MHTGTKAGDADNSIYQGLLLSSSKNCAAQPPLSIGGRGRLLTGGSFSSLTMWSWCPRGDLCQGWSSCVVTPATVPHGDIIFASHINQKQTDRDQKTAWVYSLDASLQRLHYKIWQGRASQEVHICYHFENGAAYSHFQDHRNNI